MSFFVTFHCLLVCNPISLTTWNWSKCIALSFGRIHLYVRNMSLSSVRLQIDLHMSYLMTPSNPPVTKADLTEFLS